MSRDILMELSIQMAIETHQKRTDEKYNSSYYGEYFLLTLIQDLEESSEEKLLRKYL